MTVWWSWVLAGLGLVGLWLAGSNRRVGWVVGFLAQFVWIGYALASRQWGFLLSAAGYASVYARNWWCSYTRDVERELRWQARRSIRRWWRAGSDGITPTRRTSARRTRKPST